MQRGPFHADEAGALVTNFCCCFTLCTPSADQGSGDTLAVPAEAQQAECIPTLEQFQRWLETEAHRAYHDSSIDVLHLSRCRAATMLLMQFKEGA